MANRFEQREARTPTNPGRVLDHIELKRTQSGYIVTRHFQENGYVKYNPISSEFTFDETAELQAHIKKHAKIEDPVQLPEAESEGENATE